MILLFGLKSSYHSNILTCLIAIRLEITSFYFNFKLKVYPSLNWPYSFKRWSFKERKLLYNSPFCPTDRPTVRLSVGEHHYLHKNYVVTGHFRTFPRNMKTLRFDDNKYNLWSKKAILPKIVQTFRNKLSNKLRRWEFVQM